MLDKTKNTLNTGALKPYLEFGWKLLPLHKPFAASIDKRGRKRKDGKRPLHGAWAAKTYDARAVVKQYGGINNLGVQLRDEDLVIDVDTRRNGEAGLAKLERDFKLDFASAPRVITGSNPGGSHIYLKIEKGVKIVDTLEGYEGIEFKSKGRQVVAAGSIHPDTGNLYEWDAFGGSLEDVPECPANLLEAITRPEAPSDQGEPGDVTPDQLAEMLAELDPCDFADQEKWRELMMAAHHATGGEGRSEFIEWSIGDPKYADDADIIGRRWDSCHSDRAGDAVITKGTLFAALRDHGAAHLIPRDGDPGDDFADDPLPEVLDDPEPRSLAKDLDSVTPSNVDWMWDGWLARGHMTMIAGYPGQSKSTLSLWLASVISNGGEWPDGGEAERGSVLLLSSEDHVASTIVPRLMAVGADLSKVKYVPSTVKANDSDHRRTLSLRDDLRALDATARKIGDVRLIIIDPVSAYMGVKVDAFKSTDVRGFFAPIHEWAEKIGIATLLISHFNKSGKGNALNQIIDSQAFTAMCRVVGIIGPEVDPLTGDTGRKVLACAKNNLARFPASLAYRIEGATVAGDIATSRIAWEGVTKVTADDIVNPKREKISKVEEAESFLLDALEDGPVPQKDIKARATELGHAWATVRRAADNLCVAKVPEAVKGEGRGVKAFVWMLPEESESMI